MNTRFGLWLLIGASVLGMGVAARAPDPITIKRAPVAKKTERPWLTREAKSQLLDDDGTPGPLFDGMTLGGSAPSAEARARIAEFARANHLDIRLEVADDELRAIRVSVTFGGCCGYEGADALASRFHRPKRQTRIDSRGDWVDDWAIALGGVNIRARVRVNRVEVRWEPTLSTAELLETADGIVGKPRAGVTKAAAERWIELEHGHRYTLEVPYPFRRESYGDYPAALPDDATNLQIEGEHGRIDDVAFTLRDGNIDDVKATMRARWGWPHVAGSTWTWKKSDRTITAEVDDYSSAVTIHAL